MKYEKEIENAMVKHFNSLNERERRKYAAIEAIKLDHDGKGYLVSLFKISYKTIKRGIFELSQPDILPENKCRKAGGGRKKSQLDWSKTRKKGKTKMSC
jgi:chromatin segregation and condensation protein Rec8/ScpA/Scc1 (kleisin family)